MAIFIGVALAVLSAVVIAYPFLKSRSSGQQSAYRVQKNEGDPDLDAVYEAIRTLQLEHQLGNIPQGLYQEQIQAYRVQAAMFLKRQVEAQSQDEEWLLEQEVLLARASLAQLNGHATLCPNCGATVSVALTVCPECHAEMVLSNQALEEGLQE